jgi:hypothetical protein
MTWHLGGNFQSAAQSQDFLGVFFESKEKMRVTEMGKRKRYWETGGCTWHLGGQTEPWKSAWLFSRKYLQWQGYAAADNMKEAGVDVLKPVQVSEKKNCCFSGPR